ncbi:MAG: 3-dehydroquinate synthase [Coxiellaceae bacterium]|nr:3-dehydroquinate synthase [Coxiellaceae bacterium]
MMKFSTITCQHNALQQTSCFEKQNHYSAYLIISDKTVAPLYLQQVASHFPANRIHHIILPAGETHKNIDSYQQIIDKLIQLKFDRNSCVITLGGGIITDLGGFVAATYLRGIHLINIPTSLLAQVDASIGGKTAINHNAAKNMIGAFYAADSVIIDVACLRSLDPRQFNNGMAEVIKAACIKDAEFFTWLDQNQSTIKQQQADALLHMIKQALQIKQHIVDADPYEQGERRLLNFGHTLGHAIEKASNYQLLHGEAVSIGMSLAADISQQRNLLPAQQNTQLKQLLSDWQLPIALPNNLPQETLLNSLSLDKKISNGHIKMILLQQIGQAIWQELTVGAILAHH